MTISPKLRAALALAILAAPVGWLVAGIARAQSGPVSLARGNILLDTGNIPGALIASCILFSVTLIYPRK